MKESRNFATSIVVGLARIFDFTGKMYRRSDSRFSYPLQSNPAMADASALRGDWEKVGTDLRHAIGRYGRDASATASK